MSWPEGLFTEQAFPFGQPFFLYMRRCIGYL